MPILAQEPDIYPNHLLDESDIRADENVNWWAMYCLPRQEKQLMRRLRKLDVSFYAPMIPHTTRSPAGRVRTSYVPLFKSYVFVFGDEADRHESVSTGCVSRWLEVPDGDLLTHELRQIQQLVQSEMPLSPEARLTAGNYVRIRSGPLAGLEGQIIRRENQDRLLVAVNYLQQGASVLLEDFDVESID